MSKKDLTNFPAQTCLEI